MGTGRKPTLELIMDIVEPCEFALLNIHIKENDLIDEIEYKHLFAGLISKYKKLKKEVENCEVRKMTQRDEEFILANLQSEEWDLIDREDLNEFRRRLQNRYKKYYNETRNG